MPAKPARWLIILAFLAVYLIWGSNYLAIRFAVETLPPFLMAGSRIACAGLILLAWSFFRGVPLPTKANWRAAFIAGGLLFLCNNSMISWSQAQGLPSGIASVISATVPIWVVIINWLILRTTRPSINILGGIALGMVGIVLLMNPTSVEGEINPFLALVMVLAALAWAVGSLYASQADLPKTPSLSTGMQLLMGGTQIIVLSIVSGDAAQLDIANVSLQSVLATVYAMIFTSIIGFSAYVWLIRVTSPERAATYAYVNPVVAVFLGWFIAGETLTPITLLAVGIIIFGVFLIISDKLINKERKKADALVKCEA